MHEIPSESKISLLHSSSNAPLFSHGTYIFIFDYVASFRNVSLVASWILHCNSKMERNMNKHRVVADFNQQLQEKKAVLKKKEQVRLPIF